MAKWILSVALGLAILGCDDEEPAPTASAADEVEAPDEVEAADPTAAPEAPEEPAAEVGPVATDEQSYTVTARAQEGGYDQGSLASFGIHIEAQGEWHLNDLFPFSLDVEAPDALSLPKAQLAQSDAASWEEMNANFDVPFTAASTGEHEVRATVRFAVCNPSTCVPKTAQLALHVPVH